MSDVPGAAGEGREAAVLRALRLAEGPDRKATATEPENDAHRLRGDDLDSGVAVRAKRRAGAERLAHRVFFELPADRAAGRLCGDAAQPENSSGAAGANTWCGAGCEESRRTD